MRASSTLFLQKCAVLLGAFWGLILFDVHPSANCRNKLAVCGLAVQRAPGDFRDSLLVCFPAEVDHRADVVLYIHRRGLIFHGQIWINILCDSYRLVLGVHGQPNRVCQKKVAFVVGSNSKFSDGSIYLFHFFFFLSSLFF